MSKKFVVDRIPLTPEAVKNSGFDDADHAKRVLRQLETLFRECIGKDGMARFAMHTLILIPVVGFFGRMLKDQDDAMIKEGIEQLVKAMTEGLQIALELPAEELAAIVPVERGDDDTLH